MQGCAYASHWKTLALLDRGGLVPSGGLALSALLGKSRMNLKFFGLPKLFLESEPVLGKGRIGNRLNGLFSSTKIP